MIRDMMYRPGMQGNAIRRPLPMHPGRPARNFTDVQTGGIHGSGGWRGLGNPFFQQTKGFGIDLNGNGRFDRGRDGVLAFDFDRDGRIEQKEVSGTNNMMKAASGNFDFNGDGRVDKKERFMGAVYQKKFGAMDRNRDGRLSAGEISAGGGRIWVDGNRDGRVGRGETHSPFQVPGRFRGHNSRVDVGSSRLEPSFSQLGSQPSSRRPADTSLCQDGQARAFGGVLDHF